MHRISVPSVQYAMPVHRCTTTALLQSVIQDKFANAGDKAWVRVLGTLTEAEIDAFGTTAFGDFKIAGSRMPDNASSAHGGSRETRSTALHYLGYNSANPGAAPNTATVSAAAVLLHMDPDRAAKGEYEMLLFGSLTTATNGTMVSPLVTVSEAVAAARQLDAQPRLLFQLAVESAKQTCTKMAGSDNQFTIKSGTIGLDSGSGTADDAKSPFA
ncbi:hypothetical protein AMAG_11568 [Allomyces macrogynus ATCC 38327]|uniref:Uncharacterized protein n=1 Tax=Allomyces macrogynus (strain ATCC 38327) TaxID=578462 RepID=A0A0L0SVL7_ALLM3|nr:hypothetical protein AMAG_11568 [Allomyces macrogynus ATCC 38327]|eukprot:KNE66430.1 hypothetical protein AMAG_11568 [Allomyces macrogynus ATCC 38327]